MITANLVGNDNLDFQSGFEDGEEKRFGRRLRNRKALMEIANSAADQGKALGVDEWASQVNELLGPAAFLTTTAPSQDALNVMLSEQNKRAATVAEKQRREQFDSDQKEKTAILADIHDQYLTGADPETAMKYAQERYGPELLGRLNLNFTQERQKALFKATSEGLDQGSKRFATVDQAKEFIAQNEWLPKVTADALLEGAQRKQLDTEGAVLKEAMTRGNSLGWMEESERESMRTTIDTLFPSAPADYKAQLLDKAMKTASAANKSAIARSQTEWVDQARRAEMTGAAQNDRLIIEMEEKDRAARTAAATNITTSFNERLKRQVDEAETYVKEGKPIKGVGVDAEQAQIISNGLRNYVFESTTDFIAAVKSGDKDKIRAAIKAAQPADEFRAVANGLGRLMTGNFNNVGEAYTVANQAGLGMPVKSIAEIGREIAHQRSIAADAGKSENKPKKYTGWGGGLDGDPFGLVTGNEGVDMTKDKIRQAALMNAASMEDKVIKRVAGDIRGMRDALRQNGRVGATAEDLQQHEFGMAMDRAKALLNGMGIKDPDAEIRIAQRILAEAGPPTALVRTPSASERLQTLGEARRVDQGLNPRTGVLPGASLSSPRLNQSFR